MDKMFADNVLWPVRLVLPGGGAGWSLWGGDAADGHDFLLPVGPRFALFDSAEALCRYVRHDRSAHVLTRTTGWSELVEGLAGRLPDMSEAYDFRLDRLARWSPEWTGGDLVSCVDLVWDLGAQFNDAFLIRISHGDGELRGVYEVYGDDPSDLAGSRRVAKVAKQAVERVMALSTWNPGIADG